MKLTLSRKGDYVVRAAVALGRAWGNGQYVKVRQVTSDMALPASFTPHVLGLLAKAGIVETRAGRDGGYRLMRDPATISFLEIVEAGEGTVHNPRCILRGGPCRWDGQCAAHEGWALATEALRESLKSRSLADLVARDVALETALTSTDH